ncbi:Protein of unknown function [Gryllus bimaculatus]|nr:Protein of unknown function [Gryllus bimaculatus]
MPTRPHTVVFPGFVILSSVLTRRHELRVREAEAPSTRRIVQSQTNSWAQDRQSAIQFGPSFKVNSQSKCQMAAEGALPPVSPPAQPVTSVTPGTPVAEQPAEPVEAANNSNVVGMCSFLQIPIRSSNVF